MKAFEYEPIFKKTILDSGLTVVTENHPFTRTSCAGFFVKAGTRHEPKNLLGAAHFLEHLVFKGTKTRSAYQIAKELEAVGGDLNAYTSKEYTCFHAATLREHTELSLDVLTDLVTQARFKLTDFEREREVVIHEIESAKDTLEDYIFDVYFEKAYHGHELGRSILGTEKSLAGFTSTQVKDFYRDKYRPQQLILAVAGSVEHDKVVEMVESLMKKRSGARKKPAPIKTSRKPRIQGFTDSIHAPSEQVHVLLGLPSSHFGDGNRFEGYIVNAYLGGGMTSQLYQKIRERRGLAYSVYSYLHAFLDSGLLLVYAATSKKKYQLVHDLMVEELENLASNGMKDSAIDFYKTQVLGSIVMGADDVESRMNSIGVNEMVFGEYRPVEQVVKDIEQVDKKSIKQYVQKYFDFKKMGALVMGPEVKLRGKN